MRAKTIHRTTDSTFCRLPRRSLALLSRGLASLFFRHICLLLALLLFSEVCFDRFAINGNQFNFFLLSFFYNTTKSKVGANLVKSRERKRKRERKSSVYWKRRRHQDCLSIHCFIHIQVRLIKFYLWKEGINRNKHRFFVQARCIQPTRTLSAHKWYRDYLQKKLNINLPPKRPENLEMYTRNVTLFKMCEEESFHVNFSHIQMLSRQILFQLISKFSSIFSKTTFVDQKRLLSFDKRQHCKSRDVRF